MALFNFSHRGRFRRFGLGLPPDWYDHVGSADGTQGSTLTLAVGLHPENQTALGFMAAVGPTRLLSGGDVDGDPYTPDNPLVELVGTPASWSVTWTPTDKAKAVLVFPEAMGGGWAKPGVGPDPDASEQAGEDGGVWGTIAGLAGVVLGDDDVDLIFALRMHVEAILRNDMQRRRGYRPAALFRKTLLFGQGAGAVMALRYVSERPGHFDAVATVGGSVGGTLSNGLLLPSTSVTYGRAPGDTTPWLLIHSTVDAWYPIATLGGVVADVHPLHGDWNRDTTDESQPTEFTSVGLRESVDAWGFRDAPLDFAGAVIEYTTADGAVLTLYVSTTALDATVWPDVATWQFDGLALIWRWFQDGT